MNIYPYPEVIWEDYDQVVPIHLWTTEEVTTRNKSLMED